MIQYLCKKNDFFSTLEQSAPDVQKLTRTQTVRENCSISSGKQLRKIYLIDDVVLKTGIFQIHKNTFKPVYGSNPLRP